MVLLISFLLFFLPLLVFPFGISYFETPKVFIGEILIGVLLVTYLFRYKLEFNSKQLLLLGILGFLGLLHLAFYQTNLTLFGNVYRLQGVFLLLNLLVFSYISSKFSLEKIPSWVYFISLFTLGLSTLILEPNNLGRAVGTLGEPNSLAAAALFIWPFLLRSKRRVIEDSFFALKKYLLIFSLFASSFIIYLSDSRSGIIALFIQLIFLILIKLLKISTFKAGMVGFLLILLSLTLPFLEGEIKFSKNYQSLYKFEDRLEIWKVALFAGLKNPLIGGGFGNTESLIRESAKSLNSDIQYQYVDSTHNFLLDFWVQGGILGLGVILTLLYFVLKNLIKHSKIKELTLILGVITMMLFNPVSVVTLIHFWWIIGQGFKE